MATSLKRIHVPVVKSVSVYVEEISNLSEETNNYYVYRGQAVYSWQLTAALLRTAHRKLLFSENKAIRDIISIHPREFDDDNTMFDKLVRIQHFGLPTRLLDVTINPLVALYFATEPSEDGADGRIFVIDIAPSRQKYYDSDAISCVSNLSNLSQPEKDEIAEYSKDRDGFFNKLDSVDRLVQFVRAEKPYFRPAIDRSDLFKAFHVKPKLSNKRIIAQSGSFIIYGLGLGPSYLRTINITSMKIPADCKIDIRKSLHSLGIHEATLFPEIDKAAQYIKNRYK